jgi:hypothetical protein
MSRVIWGAGGRLSFAGKAAANTHGPFAGNEGALRRLRPDPAAVTVKESAWPALV